METMHKIIKYKQYLCIYIYFFPSCIESSPFQRAYQGAYELSSC